MKKKQYVLLIASSLILFFSLIPTATYGHEVKLFLSTVLYTILPLYFLKKANNRKEKFIIIFSFLLPVVCIYGPFYVKNYTDSLVSIPSSIAPIFGIVFGTIINENRKYTILILLTELIFIFYSSTKGYDIWLHKINYGTFFGNVYEETPKFTLLNENKKKFTNYNLRNKITVLDFWNTGCGTCFKKFPLLDLKKKKFSLNPEVIFYSVNIPMTGDTLNNTYEEIKSLNYSFLNLFSENKSLAENFKVYVYPTVIIINKSGKIVYRGSLDNIDNKIEEILTR